MSGPQRALDRMDAELNEFAVVNRLDMSGSWRAVAKAKTRGWTKSMLNVKENFVPTGRYEAPVRNSGLMLSILSFDVMRRIHGTKHTGP
jgi:hypothetical protein